MSRVAFNELLKECDRLLKLEPTEGTLDRFSQLVQDPTLRQYAFYHLSNPEWIRPLFTRNFFSEPPPPVRDEESKTVSFPFWPESQYLVRMAAVAPDAVSEVIQNVPLNDNPSVMNDLLRAATTLPAPSAARWAGRAIDWVNQHNDLSLLSENLGQIISHLAHGGELKSALALARGVLAVLPDPRAEEKLKEQVSLPLDPRPRLHLLDYKRIVKKVFPRLVSAAGMDALIVLCDLLEESILLKSGRVEEQAAEDFSYIWHSDIAGEHDYYVSNHLVEAVRDATVQITRDSSDSLNEIIQILEGRRWRIFRRLALYLLKLFPDAALTVRRITDKSFFDEMDSMPEYGQLVREHFTLLNPDQRDTYLSWIEAGPDIDSEAFKNSREQWFGTRPSDKDYETFVKAWKRDHLSLISGTLEGRWRDYLSQLIAELGEPAAPEAAGHFAADVVVDRSPKSAEELASMDAEEIATFLRAWEPTPEAGGMTQAGLANTLTSLASSDPNKLARVAKRFEHLDPAYIHALLQGFRQAVEAEKLFEWRAVLGLCRFVVDQTGAREGSTTARPRDIYNFNQLRRDVASLFEAGLRTKDSGIPYDFRPLIWEVLRPLTDDPEPTPEQEARYDETSMDPATLSLNTNRGQAMHAVIRYALWVRKHFEAGEDSKALLDAGFEQMPEVREVLDYHLEPSNDPALSIRAIYGQWFPWLSLLDYEWGSKSVGKIFPSEQALSDFWFAAWQTYVIFCAPFDSVFDLLQEEYSRALGRLGTRTRWRMLPGNAEHRLAEHIYTLYWRGKLELDDPEGLLHRFLNKAPDALRGHGIGFVGRSLCNTKEAIPDRVMGRLRVLWESRVARLGENPAAHRRSSEMIEFGWWFISEKFDDAWAVTNLRRVLNITERVEPEQEVVERLAKMTGAMPREAVECVDLMIKGAREPWEVYAISTGARSILEATVKSTDAKTRRAAEDTINRFLARGYFDYRDLLSK